MGEQDSKGEELRKTRVDFQNCSLGQGRGGEISLESPRGQRCIHYALGDSVETLNAKQRAERNRKSEDKPID